MKTLTGKRILIRVDGSHAIGLGHIYRMKTLAAALCEAGCRVAFLTIKDDVANRLLEDTTLSCYVFGEGSYRQVLAHAIQAERPDVIIQDILETSLDSMSLLRERTSAKLVNLDDIGAGLMAADIVINAIVFHWGQYRVEECRARVFEGPQYMILQPEIDRYIQREKKLPEQAERILMTFGGTDTHNVTKRMLQVVNSIQGTLKIRINMGPGSHTSPSQDQAVRTSPHHVDVLHGIPSLLKEFHQADLVLCGGGNMLYELAALGVPSAALATEPHEVMNIAYWSKMGTTLSLGWEKMFEPEHIAEQIKMLLATPSKRTAMARFGPQTVDTHGVSRLLQILKDSPM